MATNTNEKTIWDYLYSKIGNAYGVAGLMGNLYAESALSPTNLQNSYEKKLGYTDTTYTQAVDNGEYTNFAGDSAGYGLAQWTYKTRKKNLKDYCDAQGTSIGDLDMQLGFLYKELSGTYKTVLSALKSATSVLEASNVVLTKFEKPANQGTTVQNKRAGYGQTYYDRYAEATNDSSVPTKTAKDAAKSYDESLAGTYNTTANLYMRNGAGTNKTAMVVLPKGTSVRCYGYYTAVNNVKWLYVQVTYKNIKYSGFCASTYLSKG